MSRNHAKSLRANMTEAERRPWYYLRAHRFAGMKFRRQAMVGPYVVDFASLQKNLIVEVDGGQHTDSESIYVARYGWKIRGFAFCGSGIRGAK